VDFIDKLINISREEIDFENYLHPKNRKQSTKQQHNTIKVDLHQKCIF